MRLALCFIFLGLVSASVKADTLTITSNQNVNGLVTYQLEKFTVEAKFKDNVTKTYTFERKKVKLIEINRTYINPGPPPPWINKFESGPKAKKPSRLDAGRSQRVESNLPPDDINPNQIPGMRPPSKAPDDAPPPLVTSAVDESMAATVPQSQITDVIKLNSTERKTGTLIMISADTVAVRVKGQAFSYSRDLVHSILVGR